MWSTSSSLDAPGLTVSAVWSRAESQLPGARMGHRHALEPIERGVRLVNEIYIRGPLARLWALVLGRQAKRGLPGWQRRAAALAADAILRDGA
jgi:hypothetical protein